MNSFQNRIKPTYYVTPNKFVLKWNSIAEESNPIIYQYQLLLLFIRWHINTFTVPFLFLFLFHTRTHTRLSDKFEKQIKKFTRLRIDNQNGKSRINRYIYIFVIRWCAWLMVPSDVLVDGKIFLYFSISH